MRGSPKEYTKLCMKSLCLSACAASACSIQDVDATPSVTHGDTHTNPEPEGTHTSEVLRTYACRQVQVQFQLQQAMGSSSGMGPTPTGRSASKSPTRRSPTRPKPFRLSDSPRNRESSQLGLSGNVAPAPSQAASQVSPRRDRAASKSPVRTARPHKVPASPTKQAVGLATSPKGRSKGAHSATRQPDRQVDRQASQLAGGQDDAAGPGSSCVMSFGMYGSVSFSSFTPEVPADSSGMVADDDDNGESRLLLFCIFAAYQLLQ